MEQRVDFTKVAGTRLSWERAKEPMLLKLSAEEKVLAYETITVTNSVYAATCSYTNSFGQ